MSKNEILINSEFIEHKEFLLVPLCSTRAYTGDYFLQLLKLTEGNHIFWSITIPPDYLINVRGKKKPYKSATPQQQHHALSHLLQNYDFENVDFLICNFEQSKTGCLHLHFISKSETLQEVKAHIMQCLKFDVRKFDDKLNINYRIIDDIYLTISYFIKEPLDYVIQQKKIKGFDTFLFNESIKSKQYEKTKYDVLILKEFKRKINID